MSYVWQLISTGPLTLVRCFRFLILAAWRRIFSTSTPVLVDRRFRLFESFDFDFFCSFLRLGARFLRLFDLLRVRFFPRLALAARRFALALTVFLFRRWAEDVFLDFVRREVRFVLRVFTLEERFVPLRRDFDLLIFLALAARRRDFTRVLAIPRTR